MMCSFYPAREFFHVLPGGILRFMNTTTLRPCGVKRDFLHLAKWFSLIEDDAPNEEGLREYYEKHRDDIILRLAQDNRGKAVGFYWIETNNPISCSFDLVVDPENRKQGFGRLLFEDMIKEAYSAGVKSISVKIQEMNGDGRDFAEKNGFYQRWHFIPMRLNLDTFDDAPYQKIISDLKGQGFRFTSMDEAGNTEENQRKLYLLNDETNMDVPGRNGEHSWTSFEDFKSKVCCQDWYKPEGQKVVIDTHTGSWVAMSAITRWQNHAYNLHTGVDRQYRGRKLAQAVKTSALCYARDVLKVNIVHTDHNNMNHPMIAVDRKFGYTELPGILVMRKDLKV
jgi:GNAT superfamily N-acetyltransferase